MSRLFTLLLVLCLIGYVSYRYFKSSPLYWGIAFEGIVSQQMLVEKTKSTGLKPQLALMYLQWPALKDVHETNLSLDSLTDIWNFGAVPCLTWEPFYFENDKKVSVLADQILSGSYDKYLIDTVQKLKKWNRPLIIRFAHEMNLKEYHWGTAAEGFGPDSPSTYIKIFRYVVNLFRLQGAHNVLWAFCPNADSVPSDPWNDPLAFYPGDEYVDIFGMDGYNWGNTLSVTQWRSFKETFSPLYLKLTTLNSRKPIIVFETASVGDELDKEKWLREALETCKKWGIVGLIWFDVNKENDWRIKLQDDVKSLFTEQPSAQDWIKNLHN